MTWHAKSDIQLSRASDNLEPPWKLPPFWGRSPGSQSGWNVVAPQAVQAGASSLAFASGSGVYGVERLGVNVRFGSLASERNGAARRPVS
jgi:hypothetical protein